MNEEIHPTGAGTTARAASPASLQFAFSLVPMLAACIGGSPAVQQQAPPASRPAWQGPRASDWLSWRGPDQAGASRETGLPERVTLGGENHAWSYPLPGRGTPVVAGGRVFALGYVGEGATVREVLVCLEEGTGKLVWEKRFRDLITDTVYSRYSIGSPTIDPETGNVFFQTSSGLLVACTRDGEVLWQVSLIEEFGKLTFPNGRTGAPLVDGELVVVHPITTTWGPALGPARDRFHAFDKKTGECVWISTPGDTPLDNSFSFPVVEDRGGKRVFYAETGCGHVVCIDLRTGDPLWRYRVATGAANASVVLAGDTLVSVHGGENLDASTIGRMVALQVPAEPRPGEKGAVELGQDAERWRLDLEAFSSSPVLGGLGGLSGNRVYMTDEDGQLCAIDLEQGTLLWKEKLAPDQVHASPLWADGKLYVPFNNGTFCIVRPTDEKPEVLDREQLEGNCLGQPAVANGRLYVHTTGELYCFGTGKPAQASGPGERPAREPAVRVAGPAVRLQVIPADVTVRPGETLRFRARGLDAHGLTTAETPQATWATELGLARQADGSWLVAKDARPAAGVVVATAGALKAESRVRIVPALPFRLDFESIALDQGGGADAPEKWGNPPGFILSSRMKWDVREKDGSQVLARVIDNPLFQRTMTVFGHPDDRAYTMQVDVLSDGTRRSMSSAGLVHQRYLIELKGNHQELEVSSNVESLKVSVPFAWQPGTWYTLKTHVHVGEDGSGVVRARVWKRGEPEPAAWTIEVPHADAHTHGSAGLFGFTPQSRNKVYLDNLLITPDA